MLSLHSSTFQSIRVMGPESQAPLETTWANLPIVHTGNLRAQEGSKVV